jgi:predicted ATPase/class 3 adenylate cyclase
MPVTPGKKFCRSCGGALTTEASGRFTGPESYTPGHLAERILISRAALEGERKQVTVLFADLKGSMALLADRDPEDARKILDPVLELMMEAVHHYEGTVNQVMGDGIMALFGAPLALEDHAVRACYSALRMQDTVKRYAETVRRQEGILPQIRVGLNSGQVVVRSIGNDLHMDYTAVGQTTHLAARMEQAAAPGSILLTADTLRFAEGYVTVKSLGPVTVKGLDHVVEAYELTGASAARTRLHAAVGRGLTRFVGRDADMEVLRRAMEQAVNGYGQIVAVVGEAGVGKSRLFYEFTHSDRVEKWLTLESHSASYSKATSYLHVIDLLKSYFKIHERDADREIREKVTGKLLTLNRVLEGALPAFLTLMGVRDADRDWQALEPPERRRRTLDAIKRLLLHESQAQPLVLVFEDLHWADSESQAVLDTLVDSLPSARVLLLVNYRPEYQHGWGNRTYYRQLRIDPLPVESAEVMLASLLGSEQALAPLKRMLIERTEGNPFFIEEIVRALVETQTLVGEPAGYRPGRTFASFEVPAKVQAILAARIDRLSPEDKRLLQTAAVVGKDVPFSLLQAVAEVPEPELRARLSRLQAAEFLYEASLFPDLAYTFKHVLTHDVAYNSLLVGRRKELHRVIAQAIEAIHANRPTEHHEMLAHHFLHAEEWTKALEYLLKAAEKAARAFANHEAIILYEQALDAGAHLGNELEAQVELAIRRAKSDIYFALSRFAESRAESECVLRLGRQADDRVTEGAALARMGITSAFSDEFDQALEYARQALEVAGETGHTPTLADGHYINGLVLSARGQLDRAWQELSDMLTITQAAGDVPHESLALGLSGFLKNFQGEYTTGARLLADSVHKARDLDLGMPLLDSLFMYGVTLTGKGDYDQALAVLDEGLMLSEKLGDELWRQRLLNSLGWLHLELGDVERGIELNRHAIEKASQRGDHEPLANAEVNLGDGFLAKGELALAQDIFDRVQRLLDEPATSEWGRWRYSTRLYASLSDLFLARGDDAKAENWADRCLEISRRTNARKNLVKGWRAKGEIAVARRRWDEAETMLRQSLLIAEEIGNPIQLWKTHASLGRLWRERRRYAEARVAYQAASEVIDGVKTRLQNPRLRASLDAAPSLREIYDLAHRPD